MMKTKRMIPGVLLILWVAVVLLTGCDVLSKKTSGEATPVATAVSSNETQVIVEGRVVPREDSDLFFMSEGEVSEILVGEDQQVTKGQVLARLGDRESYQAAVSAAELELTLAQQAVDDLTRTASLAYQQARLEVTQAKTADMEAQAHLEEIDTDDRQTKIDDAEVKLADKKDALKDAQDEFDKYADLDVDNTERKNAEDKLKEAQTAYNQAERERDTLVNELEQAKADAVLNSARLQEAQYQLDQRTDGPDKAQMAAAEARLTNAQAQLEAAQAALSNLDLLAPYDGTIVKISITVGETAIPNRSVMVIADFSDWYIETTDLTENEVVSIAVGDMATIVPDALPDLEMTAEVETISQAYQEIAGDITYETRLRLTDPAPQLRWGMTVEVTFNEK